MVDSHTFYYKMRLCWVYGIFALVILYQLAEVSGQNRVNNGVRRNVGKRSQQRLGSANNINNRIRAGGQVNRARQQTRNVAATNRQVNRVSSVNGNGNGNRSKRQVNGNARAATGGNIQAKIVGGSQTTISTMPYLVQVHNGAVGFCGGSLIRSNWVLTAAHCVVGTNHRNLYVLAGTSTQSGTDAQNRTVTYSSHPRSFTRRNLNRDVALLKLSSAMTLGTNVATIRLGRRVPRAGSMVRIGGWGATREGGSPTTNLRSTQIRVVSKPQCQRAYQRTTNITPFMFCARSSGKDTCSGDSGGPVVQNGRVMGVVSFGRGCARPRFPGVYADVSALGPWIRSTMANN